MDRPLSRFESLDVASRRPHLTLSLANLPPTWTWPKLLGSPLSASRWISAGSSRRLRRGVQVATILLGLLITDGAPSQPAHSVAPTPQPAKPAAPPAAQPAGPAAPAAAPVWSVDKAASRLSFKAATTGLAVDGVFKKWDAQVAFDPKNLKGSRILLVVQTASAVTGNPVWDQALASQAWFAPKAFPKAVFFSRTISATDGAGRYSAAGELKLRGTGRRASFVFTSPRTGGRLVGVLLVDRSAFKLGPSGPAAAAAVFASDQDGSIPPMANQLALNVRLSAKKH